MFIKRGDGKITSVIEEDNLTEHQKRAARDLARKTNKSEPNDTSLEKKLGAN
jgi:hypothetical protein